MNKFFNFFAVGAVPEYCLLQVTCF